MNQINLDHVQGIIALIWRHLPEGPHVCSFVCAFTSAHVLSMYSAAGCSWPAHSCSSPFSLWFLLSHQALLSAQHWQIAWFLCVDVSVIPTVHCTYCCTAGLTFPIRNCHAGVAVGTHFPFSPEAQSAGIGCQGGTGDGVMQSSVGLQQHKGLQQH